MHTQRYALLGAATLTWALAALGGGPVRWADASPVTGAAAVDPVRQLHEVVGVNGVPQTRLLAIADDVTRQSGGSFEGVVIDAAAGLVDVYTTGSPVAAATAITATSSALSSVASLLRFHQVPLTKAGLDHAMAQATPVAQQLVATGVPLQSWGLDLRRGLVHVSLRGATTEQRQATENAFRTLPVYVDDSGFDIHTAVGSDSAHDKAPFVGGDFIYDSRDFCSSAFGIRIGGTAHVLTAGHCGNGKWYNDTSLNGKRLVGANHFLGRSSRNTWNTATQLDHQVLAGAGTANIWTGDYLSGVNTAVVTGTAGQQAGTSFCTDGAFEGTICGITLSSDNYNACIVIGSDDGSSVTTCHIYEGDLPAGQVALGQGDSGGPVVVAAFQGSHVVSAQALGLITAETVDNLRCPFFTWRGNVCSHSVFYTGISDILNNDAATLMTR